jgi:hypothetical protein
VQGYKKEKAGAQGENRFLTSVCRLDNITKPSKYGLVRRCFSQRLTGKPGENPAQSRCCIGGAAPQSHWSNIALGRRMAAMKPKSEYLPAYDAQKSLPGPGRVQFQPQVMPVGFVAVSFRIQLFCFLFTGYPLLSVRARFNYSCLRDCVSTGCMGKGGSAT